MFFALYLISSLFGHVGCSKPQHAYLIDTENCNRYSQNASVTDQIHEIQDAIEWWGATTEQVSAAPCKTKAAPTPLEMQEAIHLRSGNQRVTETVHGVRFENEPKALVDAFKQLTTRTTRLGSPHGVREPQVQIQSTFQVNPECKRVECAIKKMWGESLGNKILFMKLKHGYNASELAFDDSSRFTIPEIDDVLMALEDLPPSMHPLGLNGNQRMVPFTRGTSMYSDSSRTLANSGIIYFDSWRERAPLVRQYTAFHELSHNISSRNSTADNSAEWRELSGWKYLGEDGWERNPNACMISKYSKDSPAEDFAEVLSAYRYNAKGLAATCPEKYRYMKDKIFGGTEYQEISQCTQVHHAQVLSVQDVLANHLLEHQYPIGNDIIGSECTGSFTSYPPQQSELELCSLKATIQIMPSERLSEIFRQAGLSLNSHTKMGLIQSLDTGPRLRSALQRQARFVDQAMESMLGTYRLKLNQVSPPDRASGPWLKSRRDCGFVMLEMPQEAARCYVEAISIEDQALKEWGAGFLPTLQPPQIFSQQAQASLRREDRLMMEETLLQSSQLRSHLSLERAQFKRDSLAAVRMMRREANLPVNWQNLTPEDFCSRVYGKSNSSLMAWGLGANDSLSPIVNECVRIQQAHDRRQHPSEEEWIKWADLRWN